MLIEKPSSRAGALPARASEPSLTDKIAFLSRGEIYRPPVSEVGRRETHMSHVFLAGDHVVKLKKPVR